jgi:Trp operon repressor
MPPELLQALARLDAPADVGALLTDLLSPAERSALAERWAIVALLRQGKSQRAVRDAVGCSIATVSRGAALVQSGGEGLRRAFDVLALDEQERT